MEKTKIKLKYSMNLWKSLPQYPTAEDVLYDIQLYLIKEKKKEFSNTSMNYVWDVLGSTAWIDTKFQERFEELITNGFINKIEKNFNDDRQWFVINDEKNPFV
jgi:hypothetical protein